MKKSSFTGSQILVILKQDENGIAVADLCRERAISNATYYNRHSKYGGMGCPVSKRNAAERGLYVPPAG